MKRPSGERPAEILLVEDNPGDVRLTKEAFRGHRIANRMHVSETGEDALRFLHGEGEYADAARPDLILLDINLPGISGFDVLQDIKNSEDLRSIPVVILTTSEAEIDILRSYNLHANCYITKPVDFGKFLEVVGSIESFWLMVVALPDGARPSTDP